MSAAIGASCVGSFCLARMPWTLGLPRSFNIPRSVQTECPGQTCLSIAMRLSHNKKKYASVDDCKAYTRHIGYGSAGN